MLGSASDGQDGRLTASGGQTMRYLAVEDPDEHCRPRDRGGRRDRPPLEDTDYGSRGYTARDPEGNLWSFGAYQPAAPGS